MAICLKGLGKGAGGRWHGQPQVDFATGFVCDARQVLKGEVFVAFKGQVHDGHAFLAQARDRGACAAIVSQVDPSVDLPQLAVPDPLEALRRAARQQRKRMQGPVVAITGSCGKTSTKDLLQTLLGKDQTHANHLNFNGQIGVPLTLLGLDPDAHRFAVIEAGISEPGEMDLLEELILPDHCILTSIWATHLQYLKTEINVAVEKAKLAQRVRGRILFHEEFLRYRALQALAPYAWVAHPLKDQQVNTLGYHLEDHSKGTDLTLWLPCGHEHRFSLGWMSLGQQKNTVLALALALDLGVEPHLLQERLALWQPSPKRGEVFTFPQSTVFLDAYNASPASMQDSLRYFQRRFASELPRLYIIGSMAELSNRASEAHRALGQQLSLRPQDTAYLIGLHAHEVQQGIGSTQAHVSLQPELDLPALQEAIKAFHGNVFIKGSHPLALERCLE